LYGVNDLSCVCRGCETATLSVDRLLGNSFATPKVPCDCLKVGLDVLGVLNELPSSQSTDSVAVSQPRQTHSSSLKPYNSLVAVYIGHIYVVLRYGLIICTLSVNCTMRCWLYLAKRVQRSSTVLCCYVLSSIAFFWQTLIEQTNVRLTL